MVGQHHQLNEHEFEQTLGDSKGRWNLACCSPWGHRVGHNDWTRKLEIERNYLSLIIIYIINLQLKSYSYHEYFSTKIRNQAKMSSTTLIPHSILCSSQWSTKGKKGNKNAYRSKSRIKILLVCREHHYLCGKTYKISKWNKKKALE